MAKTTPNLLYTLLLIMLLMGCKSDSKNPGDQTISISYLPIIPDLPLFVAVENGLFEKYGLTPKLIKISGSGNQVVESIARGDSDVGYLALSTVLEAEQQAPGGFIISHFNIDAQDLPNLYGLITSDTLKIKEIRDLKGKKIGTFPGAAMLSLTKLMLKANGINSDEDVSIVQLAPPAQIAAINSGQVDALLTLEPIVAMANETKSAFLIDKYPLTPAIDAMLPSGSLVFSSTLQKNDKEKVNKVINVIDDAIQFIRANPKKASDLYMKYCDIPEKIAKQLPVLHYWKNDEVKIDVIQRYADMLQKENVLKETIIIENILVRNE